MSQSHGSYQNLKIHCAERKKIYKIAVCQVTLLILFRATK